MYCIWNYTRFGRCRFKHYFSIEKRPVALLLKDAAEDYKQYVDIEIDDTDTKPNDGVILVSKTEYTNRISSVEAIYMYELIKNLSKRKGGVDEICFGMLAKKYGIQVVNLENKYNAVLQNEKEERPSIFPCMGKNKIWKNIYWAMMYPEFLESNSMWIKLGDGLYGI